MFKVLTKGCEPTRGSRFSAGIDLYSSEDVVIGAGETAIVGLGVCIDLEYFRKQFFRSLDVSVSYLPVKSQDKIFDSVLNSHYLELYLQNNLSEKGLISNAEIINLAYEDEIKIIIHNPICGVYQDFQDGFDEDFKLLETHTYNAANNEVRYTVKKGDKIAQILLKEHKSYLFGIESEEERTGGFGSTDE